MCFNRNGDDDTDADLIGKNVGGSDGDRGDNKMMILKILVKVRT